MPPSTHHGTFALLPWGGLSLAPLRARGCGEAPRWRGRLSRQTLEFFGVRPHNKLFPEVGCLSGSGGARSFGVKNPPPPFKTLPSPLPSLRFPLAPASPCPSPHAPGIYRSFTFFRVRTSPLMPSAPLPTRLPSILLRKGAFFPRRKKNKSLYYSSPGERDSSLLLGFPPPPSPGMLLVPFSTLKSPNRSLFPKKRRRRANGGEVAL